MARAHSTPTGRPYSVVGGAEYFDLEGYRSRRLPRFPALEELKDTYIRRQLFEDMADNSATTSAFIWTVRQMAAQSKWRFVGEEGDERKTFLESVFFKDLNQDWDDFLSSALTMLVHGWSLMEIVHKIRVGPEETSPQHKSHYTDRKIGLRMMSYRPQLSIYNWMFHDDGRLKSVEQTMIGSVAKLDAKNLLFFRTTGTRPDGISILRGAYTPYFRSQVLEYLEAIGIERDLAGLPFFHLTDKAPDIWNPEDSKGQIARKELEKLAQGIRQDRIDGIIVPEWVEAELLSAKGGTRSLNIKDALSRYDLRLLQALMADFLLLGTAKGAGSYGLGVSRQSLFLLAVDGFLSRIAKIVNYQLITDLLLLNDYPVEDPPILTVDPLNPRDLSVLGSFFQQMSQAGLYVKATKELEKFLSDATDLPIEFMEQLSNPTKEPEPAKSPPKNDG